MTPAGDAQTGLTNNDLAGQRPPLAPPSVVRGRRGPALARLPAAGRAGDDRLDLFSVRLGQAFQYCRSWQNLSAERAAGMDGLRLRPERVFRRAVSYSGLRNAIHHGRHVDL